MIDQADKRGQLIRHLENALALADEIEDGQTGYLIERALDEHDHVNLGRSGEPEWCLYAIAC
jgi:DNA-binding ferritin-like protein